ncbi:protein dopey-2 isoform X2 [Megalops cyprinoides]|uniref:protein dopey-2 isoform X2 n=1 Tax=Megalops cyprinoides TaxID=118141 RepID=UPI001864B8FC|nr:protein dopey-2 isoform X2 [Megalops cyprinoides]
MDPEEQELQNDYRYRSYAAVIEKALRNFESSSEWADLISSLGKLNKALQSNLKYSLLPKRLIICKRLAQCLHPALPSGVHLKALETYEVIFKIIGTKWLAKDLFIYSSGLFPLLGHAAMSVKPVLLTLYERYYLPLQRALLPSLQAFVTGLLPGLEEGLEVYDRTDALLVKLSLLVGQQVFYGALWGSVLISPLVRLPASLFIVSHFDRTCCGKEQRYMLGSDHRLVMKSICLSLQDSNVLVQRNMLEILLVFFPFYSFLDPAEGSIPMTPDDMVIIVSAASLTLLRRDMSLNRRLYAWLLGMDIKGGMLAPNPVMSTTLEDHMAFYFDTYSRGLLVQALINILKQKNEEMDTESMIAYLRPFRVIISLLDKAEIGPQITDELMLEVVRAFYRYCREALGEDAELNSSFTGNQMTSKIKENRTASEIIKTVNMLISSMRSDYLWDYMIKCFQYVLSRTSEDPAATMLKDSSDPLSISELATLIIFLLDVIPLELDSEIQTQYLPQMLGSMLKALRDHMTVLSLSELTQGLRACFKVLSKIQMPMVYMDMEAELQTQGNRNPVQNHTMVSLMQARKRERQIGEGAAVDEAKQVDEDDKEEEEGPEMMELNEEADHGVGTADAALPPLRSEDSGLGLSASPSEQHLLLGGKDGGSEVCPEKDEVWRKGGSVEGMTHCMQDILAAFITRYLLYPVEEEKRQADKGQSSPPAASPGKKALLGQRGSREMGQISIPQFKEKLTEFFTPGKQRQQQQLADGTCFSPIERKQSRGSAGLDWGAGYKPRDRVEISEACRQAFTAACHLLLECTTFPVYLSEDEMEALYTTFQSTGNDEDTLPLWLRSLMVCCLSKDYHIQHVAMSSLLELINHSQSLALVIEDKNLRYKSSENNPFCGRLQMVTVPPIYPRVLAAIEKSTNFYQHVAQVLWGQLDTERREHHISCVELFYRLHCLAPSPAICEDIICLALLHRDKMVRLEALHRFSVLWHLTREIQNNRTMTLNRSFDRSLFVVLDSLNSPDGSISAAGQSWLVRAFSLNDVVRILEPVLLLLLHPRTQRSSIQHIKQNLTVGKLKLLSCKEFTFSHDYGRSNDVMLSDSLSEESLLSRVTIVDREALWAEVEHIPETVRVIPQGDAPENGRSRSKDTDGEEDGEGRQEEEEGEDSEHTESADTSGAQLSTENSSSGSAPYLQHPYYDSSMEKAIPNGLQRNDSDQTQVSDSLSSDEDDLELEALARSRLLKQQQEKREAIDSLFRHMLLYLQPYDSTRVLYAFSVLETLLKTNGRHFVEAISTTGMDTSSTAHLNLIYNLLQRHREALEGRSFYGRLQAQSPSPCPFSLLAELLTCLCLRFLRSYYPCYLSLGPWDLPGNREVQVKSVEVLTHLMSQLVCLTGVQDGRNVDFIRHLLSGCEVQRYILLSLSASMYISQRPVESRGDRGEQLLEEQGGLSEESLISLGQGPVWSEQPLQMELLKLLQVLIVLEHHVWPGRVSEGQDIPATSPLAKEWQTAMLFQQSIRALQYVQAQPIPSQGMFVSAAARALQPQYGYAMHPPWVSLICASLPYLGRSLAVTVTPFIVQICKNLDDLVKHYEHESAKISQSWSPKRENIAPDYPLTLMEGLTTITHYCLLDNRKCPMVPDLADIRNARNAILEELPRMLNSMALLWGVVRREETQRKSPNSALSCGRNTSTSLYFKSTKILRQKVLGFLNPLMMQFGVQVMASVAAVWNSRKSRGSHNKNKIFPVASESRQAIVDLVKSLSTLHTDTILQLVKEVVKKPHQIKGDQKSTLVDIPMLQFSFAFMQGLSAQTLQENVTPLLNLLKESVQLNLAAPGHFLLLGILNDFVNRLPNLDNKKDTRDIQEVTQRILEAVGSVAGSSLEQTSWLSRNLEVKAQPQVCLEEEDPEDMDLYDSDVQANTMVSSSAPSVYSVQALTLLAEVLAPLLDMVYRSDEKEKAVPLISRLMYYVFPYLKNHSTYNMPSFCAGAQLLSSLSGYAYTKRAWKKEAFDLYMDPLFFHMDTSCAPHWQSIIDHLLTHEKTMFKDLMSMQSSSLKLFPNYEQKAMLLKRQAFAMFSGERDQYHLYLPLIQERLTENLRVGQTASVAAQMFLTFRVLLLRISPQHLTSLWPIMVTELIRVFVKLEKALLEDRDISKNLSKGAGALGAQERNGPVFFSQNELDMYLSACKFLDTALSFPPDRMPLFQMYRWAFVPEVDVDSYSGLGNSIMEGEQDCKPHIIRVMEGLHSKFGDLNGTGEGVHSEHLEFPLLTLPSISSITQLVPFFRVLGCSFKGSGSNPQPQLVAEYPAPNSDIVLRKLEQIIGGEFLESMDA